MNQQAIHNAFAARGIFASISTNEYAAQKADIALTGSYDFAAGGELSIQSRDSELATAQLIDMQGRVIRNLDLQQEKMAIISSQGLSTGVYILQVTDVNGRSSSFKLTRALR
jgi:hypothetical protein